MLFVGMLSLPRLACGNSYMLCNEKKINDNRIETVPGLLDDEKIIAHSDCWYGDGKLPVIETAKFTKPITLETIPNVLFVVKNHSGKKYYSSGAYGQIYSVNYLHDPNTQKDIDVNAYYEHKYTQGILISSGYVFDSNTSSWKATRVYIDDNRSSMITSEGNIYNYSECMMCHDVILNKGGRMYHVTPFTDLPTFGFFTKPDNFYDLQQFVKSYPIPKYINIWYTEILANTGAKCIAFGNKVIGSKVVYVPVWLKIFFGAASPIFDENENLRLYPEDMAESFGIIIKWCKQLAIRDTWPSVAEMVSHGFDIYQWKTTAKYFHICRFDEFFSKFIEHVTLTLGKFRY